MPTWFCRGPPFTTGVPHGSAYSESRHSVLYADFGIGYDVVVVGELYLAKGAFPALLDNLSVHELPHLCGGSEFAITSRVVRIFDTLHAEPYELALFLSGFAATTVS